VTLFNGLHRSVIFGIDLSCWRILAWPLYCAFHCPVSLSRIASDLALYMPAKSRLGRLRRAPLIYKTESVGLVRVPGRVSLCQNSRRIYVTGKDPFPRLTAVYRRQFLLVVRSIGSKRKTSYIVLVRPLYHYKIMPFDICPTM